MRRVEWSLEARYNLSAIMGYLESEWTEKEVRHFSERLEKQLLSICESPEMYKKSLRKTGLWECQITSHNTLVYSYDDATLYVVTIFDNRQNPEKLINL